MALDCARMVPSWRSDLCLLKNVFWYMVDFAANVKNLLANSPGWIRYCTKAREEERKKKKVPTSERFERKLRFTARLLRSVAYAEVKKFSGISESHKSHKK